MKVVGCVGDVAGVFVWAVTDSVLLDVLILCMGDCGLLHPWQDHCS